jgi:methylphosphotriester-DNA--protein-cysteine methyltransferase
MRALRDLVLPLDEILPHIAEEVFESLNRVQAIQGLLMRRAGERNRIVERAVNVIDASRGDIRVRQLASAIGTTERSLERAFDKAIGIGPKTLSRIARLQATLRGEDGGYYDDADRIHDFTELAGVTPSQFTRERNEMNAAIVGNLQDHSARPD